MFAANVIIIVCIGALQSLMHVHVVCVCVHCTYSMHDLMRYKLKSVFFSRFFSVSVDSLDWL